MTTAHYMIPLTTNDPAGAFDRVGGLPSYLPPEFPTSAAFGNQYCFLLQILSMERLGLERWRCLQLYQSGEIDEGDDPMPVVVLVPLDAAMNHDRQGRPSEAIEPRRIDWEVRDDPNEIPTFSSVTDDRMDILESKLGGVPPHMEVPLLGARFLGQIREGLGGPGWGFNFGGLLLTLWEAPDGRVFAALV